MSTETVFESGLQLITRLIDRRSVEDLDNDLFFNKLQNSDVIEIKGTITSGMRCLLTKLIAKFILPSKYDGLDVDVLFINTENQFQISHLFNFLQQEISNIQGPINVDQLVREILNSLKIINCYTHNQLLLTLHSLDNLLLQNKKVGVIVIDSISTYYWQQKNDLSYNSFIMKILNNIRKVTIDFKVLTIYTKQFNFESKKLSTEQHEGKKIVRYEINMYKNENTNEFICDVKSGADKKQLSYRISETGLQWIK
ncbi:X-ray repair cross complementing protein 2 isoform X1 [Nasonia vitripennis]|uniref:Rad51-like C-terminal domain-containing protein n=1 Tax=Nasonia vitripennis TaxID=7425 RepID=A0A7M6UCU1_NASVI|nr:X-ray repair cross complementing protein 2 [Nasonia vitripennis]XP_008215062.1 X-ray repair cross complementing protein 2 isoform X1 [Nasonia vitripennis]